MSGVCFTSLHSKIQICCSPPRSPLFPGSLSDVRTLSSKFKDRRASGIAGTKLFCSNSFPPAPEERDSKTVLESFFLGKAFAEAINERIETTVGEILSTIGMLQAEQLKQLQDFQWPGAGVRQSTGSYLPAGSLEGARSAVPVQVRLHPGRTVRAVAPP